MTNVSSRLDAVVASRGPLCVGIDPSSDSLVRLGLPDTADGALQLSRHLVNAASELVGIVKPQVGYFERFGSAGYRVLETVISEARQAGLAVIADAKRGDIGTTMDGYAEAWLGEGPLKSDALTVNPYLGLDALEPAFSRAEGNDATVFVLAATSNPDAPRVQGATQSTRSLPQIVADFAKGRNTERRTVGLVVGATRSLTASGLSSHDVEGLLILAPGFGAQGASLADISAIFGHAADRVIPSVSRSVVAGGIAGISDSIGQHLRELGL